MSKCSHLQFAAGIHQRVLKGQTLARIGTQRTDEPEWAVYAIQRAFSIGQPWPQPPVSNDNSLSTQPFDIDAPWCLGEKRAVVLCSPLDYQTVAFRPWDVESF